MVIRRKSWHVLNMGFVLREISSPKYRTDNHGNGAVKLFSYALLITTVNRLLVGTEISTSGTAMLAVMVVVHRTCGTSLG